MADIADPQLELKKRARRRLVGAVAFATLAAVVLPMVMDEAPPAPASDIQIRIPGQDQTTFTPRAVVRPAASPAAHGATPAAVPTAPAPALKAEAAAAPAKSPDKESRPVEKTAEKPVRPADKSLDKAVKPAEKTVEKPAAKTDADAERAASILGGKAEGAAASGQYVILIGAFANAGNVKILQTKLGQMGIKTFTQPLDTPQGKKTRVRAGPFANRQAADKALDRMKKIGVSGVVAAKDKA